MNRDFEEKILLNLRRGYREVFEHEPHELLLSINGDIEHAQKIEQTVTKFKIELDEMPQFVEIFSEQNVCLAFLSFGEEAPPIKKQQKFTFDFSEKRKLLVKLKKDESKIIINAIYENPLSDDQKPALTEDKTLAEFLRKNRTETQNAPIFGGLIDSRKESFIERLKNSLLPSFVNFKTLLAGGSLAVLVITAILIAKIFILVPILSASEIIQKVVNFEQLNENDMERVVYRVLDFEEKNADGVIIKKRRIEFFNDAVRKLAVKRLFDENNRLIAGEWRRKDGVRTVYEIGKASQLSLNQTDKEIISKDLENIWQITVSAKGFESLVELPENITVSEQNNVYQINYQPPTDAPLAKAVLFINKNLLADKLLLTFKQNGSLREFSFTQSIFEQKLRGNVEKNVFEPNAEFLKNGLSAVKTTSETEKQGQSTNANTAQENGKTEVSSTGVSPETEVRVLQLLNSVNALSGEQINIIKTPDGKIQIKGIVDTKKRKDEILNALAELRGNPAISINIQTAEDAAKNQSSKNNNGTLESISVESNYSIPAGEILRNHFAAQGLSEDKIETEIRRFASNVLAKSSQVRRSALQMKQIAERFSPANLETMDETTKNNWRKLIKQNAANLAQSAENLRSDLRVINIEVGTSGGNVNAANDADLIRAAKRLFELSMAIDRDVRASFSSGGTRNNVPVKSGGFAGNLAEIIGLSRQIR